jgi:hypothetical protein
MVKTQHEILPEQDDATQPHEQETVETPATDKPDEAREPEAVSSKTRIPVRVLTPVRDRVTYQPGEVLVHLGEAEIERLERLGAVERLSGEIVEHDGRYFYAV